MCVWGQGGVSVQPDSLFRAWLIGTLLSAEFVIAVFLREGVYVCVGENVISWWSIAKEGEGECVYVCVCV